MALEQIKQVTGTGVYVPGDDIDTDHIIPARFLLCVTFDGLGGQLFYDARFERDGDAQGAPAQRPALQGRQGAPRQPQLRLRQLARARAAVDPQGGLPGVIAESFAEIFFGNSTTLGIPCVSLKRQEIARSRRAIEADPKTEITVDLEQLEVRAGGKYYPCSSSRAPGMRWCAASGTRSRSCSRARPRPRRSDTSCPTRAGRRARSGPRGLAHAGAQGGA